MDPVRPALTVEQKDALIEEEEIRFRVLTVCGGRLEDRPRSEAEPVSGSMPRVSLSDSKRPRLRIGGYDRRRAVQYANLCGTATILDIAGLMDCTNYVSQCIHAGEFPWIFPGADLAGGIDATCGATAGPWRQPWYCQRGRTDAGGPGEPAGRTPAR